MGDWQACAGPRAAALALAVLLASGCGCSDVGITGDADADADPWADPGADGDAVDAADTHDAPDLADSHDAADTADGPDDTADPDVPADGYPDFGDSVIVPDVVYDSFHDASWDVDALECDAGGEPPPIAISPSCGDGVLDPGEECDDRNRLNGDGCDWTCRLGDGDPPPPPDDMPPYDPSGPTTYLPGFEGAYSWSLERLPLVWTGSEYATAAFLLQEDTDRWVIRMRRFLPDATPLGADWVFDVKSTLSGGDLAWTGSEYALFFVDGIAGIEMLRVSADGEPLGFPVNVERDYRARAPAVAVTDTGFVVAWVIEGNAGAGLVTSWCGDWSAPRDRIMARLVGYDGATSGPAVLVEDLAGGPPDVAAGTDGYAITVMENSTPSRPQCSLRLVRLSADLSEATYSGYLSDGQAGDVTWADGRYIAAWPHYDTAAGGYTQQCVARFTPEGTLEGPPTCTGYESPTEYAEPGFTRLASGDSGLAIVFSEGADQILMFLRTDIVGAAIDAPRGVAGSLCDPMPLGLPCHFGPFNTVWADDGFGVLAQADIRAVDLQGLFMWTFRARPEG